MIYMDQLNNRTLQILQNAQIINSKNNAPGTNNNTTTEGSHTLFLNEPFCDNDEIETNNFDFLILDLYEVTKSLHVENWLVTNFSVENNLQDLEAYGNDKKRNDWGNSLVVIPETPFMENNSNEQIVQIEKNNEYRKGSNEILAVNAETVSSDNIINEEQLWNEEETVEKSNANKKAIMQEKMTEDSISEFLNIESDTSEQELNQKNSKRKRKKRCFVNSDEWVKNRNKKKRESGQAYSGKKKVEGKWIYNIPKRNRKIKPRCNCKQSSKTSNLQCSSFSEGDRQAIFLKFWSEYNWREKKLYVQLLIDIKATARHRNRKEDNKSRRENSLEYHLRKSEDKLRVCKRMFLSTLGIGERMAHEWKKTQHESLETKKLPSTEPTNESKDKNRKEDLREFFRQIPKMESHYGRASSSKLYLESSWHSKADLYSCYKNTWCKDKKFQLLSISSFYYIFDEMKLSLFRPKKDECETCIIWKAGNLSDDRYKQHRQMRLEAREAKSLDKVSENRIFCMDLQSVLLCPKSNVSTLYFKTKLIVHNFTLYDMQTKDGYCYLWHEGTGGVTSNNYCSIICHFLEKYVVPTLNASQSIIIYSDGCTSQNRNSNLANTLLNFALHHKVNIEQKFLEKGHTQMEADSIHSAIERKVRNTNIKLPADYIDVCLKARKKPRPYKVEYLDYTFFKNFSELKYITSLRPGRKIGDPLVTDLRALKYCPDGTIWYKLRHTDEYSPFQFRNIIEANSKALKDLPQLYQKPTAIKKEKWDHLQDLKKSLNAEYHNFYDTLPYVKQ